MSEGNGLIEMMLAGLGIRQHLRPFVQTHLDSGMLVEIMHDWTRPSLLFHIIYPLNRHQNAKLKVFIDWLAYRFSNAEARSRSFVFADKKT
ncbi:LysR substrate-binding domain-containing protein [Dickeya chrysanthemi]|uniref:LysR substrate-binding domain-containing protein n=1 Tax=Dickeya chrysanthemi TaxID=556 RepID=UPI003016B4F5